MCITLFVRFLFTRGQRDYPTILVFSVTFVMSQCLDPLYLVVQGPKHKILVSSFSCFSTDNPCNLRKSTTDFRLVLKTLKQIFLFIDFYRRHLNLEFSLVLVMQITVRITRYTSICLSQQNERRGLHHFVSPSPMTPFSF